MSEKIQQLLQAAKARIRRRAARWALLLLAAFVIGEFGALLIEGSRWVGVIAPPDVPKESQVYRWLVRLPARWLGESLLHLDFDLPQMMRNTRPTPEVCIIYMDEQSSTDLGQGSTWDRKIHADLLRRLKADGAKAVFFDIVFSGARNEPDTASDIILCDALKDFGNAFIGGGIDLSFRGNSENVQVIPPKPIFRRAGIPWGLLVYRPIDSDYAIRAMFTGTEQVPSLSWRAAEKLGAKLPADAAQRGELRWLNYYGAPGTFENRSYSEALNPKGVRPGFFKDRIVFVGGRSALAVINFGKDDFRTPYSRMLGGKFAPGVEIHATAMLNLLRGEWLTRIPYEIERRIAFWFGFLLTLLLVPRVPWLAWAGASVAVVVVALLAIDGVQHRFIWGNWLVLASVQPALVIAANYLFEGRRRSAVKKAFGLYLSPEMARQISSGDFDLKPGGKVVEATIMFTDLEGFTSLSEELADPERLSVILTQYFTQCTGHVLGNQGMIVKFIGDAVLAVWGAPVPNPDHARNAVQAAWRLHQSSEIQIDGKPLLVRGKKVRTRVGVHTGKVLAGNLGSTKRFDYTVIGDPVNLSARLESLNKHLGSCVLISEETRMGMGEGFISRGLGRYILKGKVAAIAIHELLGEVGRDAVPEWLPSFSEGAAAFKKGDVAAADAAFRKVIAARGGADGPSQFLVDEIARRAAAPATPWSEDIELHEK